MKKILFFLVMAIPFAVDGQTQYVDKLRVREEIRLQDKTVETILDDETGFPASTHLQLATARAIEDYINSRLATIPQLWTESGANIYRASGLVGIRRDPSTYELEVEGETAIYEGTNGILFDPSTRTISSVLGNTGLTITGSGGNSQTEIKGLNVVNIDADDDSGDGVKFRNLSEVIQWHWRFGDRVLIAGQTGGAAWRMEGGSGSNSSGRSLTIRGGEGSGNSGAFIGGALYLDGGISTATGSPIGGEVILRTAASGTTLVDRGGIDHLGNWTVGDITATNLLDVNGEIRLRGLGSAPTGDLGVIYTNSVDNSLYFHNGTAFEKLAFDSGIPASLWTTNGTNIHPATAESISIGNTSGVTNTRLRINSTGTGSSHYAFKAYDSGGTLKNELTAQGEMVFHGTSARAIDIVNDQDIRLNNNSIMVWGNGGPHVQKQNNGVGLRGSSADGTVVSFIRQNVEEGKFTGANGMELDRITTYTQEGTLDISGWRGGSGTKGGHLVLRGGTGVSTNLGYGGTLFLRGGGGNSGATVDTAGIVRIQVPLDGGGALQDMAIFTNEYVELEDVGINTTGVPTADLDVNGSARFRGLSSAPTGDLGGLYTNSVDNKLYFHNGTAWQELATGGGTTFWVDGDVPGVDVTLTGATQMGVGTTDPGYMIHAEGTSNNVAKFGDSGTSTGYWVKIGGNGNQPTMEVSAGSNSDDAFEVSAGDLAITGSGTEFRISGHTATNIDQFTISKNGGRLAAFTTVGTSGGTHVVAMGRDVDDLAAPILELMATNSFATNLTSVYDPLEISSRVSPGSTSFNRWNQNAGLGWSIYGRDQATGSNIRFHRQYAQKINETNDPSDIKYFFQSYWDGGAYTPMNFSGNGVYIGGTTTATAALDVGAESRFRDAILLDPRSSEPTGSAGKIYSDSDDDKLYHHDGSNFEALAYEKDLPNAPAYGNLSNDAISAELDIAGSEPAKTVSFNTTGISSNTTLTDTTITVTNAGDYEIKFHSTFFWTANGGGIGDAATFLLYVDDVFVGEAGFTQNLDVAVDEYTNGSFIHQLALSANDVLKIKVTGGGTTNKIKYYRASFSVERLDL